MVMALYNALMNNSIHHLHLRIISSHPLSLTFSQLKPTKTNPLFTMDPSTGRLVVFAQQPQFEDFDKHKEETNPHIEALNIEMLLMAICGLLIVLVVINLSRFCYQVCHDRKQKKVNIYAQVSKDADIDV